MSQVFSVLFGLHSALQRLLNGHTSILMKASANPRKVACHYLGISYTPQPLVIRPGASRRVTPNSSVPIGIMYPAASLMEFHFYSCENSLASTAGQRTAMKELP